MQQAARMKGFVVDHVIAIALACVIVASGLAGVAIVAGSDDLSSVTRESPFAAKPNSSVAWPIDRADAIQQVRGQEVAVSSTAGIGGLDRADAIAQVRGAAESPTLDVAALGADWIRLTHRYWTPELQSRLMPSGQSVE